MNVIEKRCGKCRKLYSTAASRDGNRAFDPHAGKGDERQPFCRSCDWDEKHKPHRGWSRLIREASKRELIVGLNPIEYGEIISCNRCQWCRGTLFRWGGYWLDRYDSKGHYEIGNVYPCCRWCNHYKNALPPELWAVMIGALIREKGIGSGESRWFDWSAYGEQFRSSRPDVSRFEIRSHAQVMLAI